MGLLYKFLNVGINNSTSALFFFMVSGLRAMADSFASSSSMTMAS